MNYDNDKLQYFKECLHDIKFDDALNWVGAVPDVWSKSAGLVNRDLPDFAMCRHELRTHLNCDDPLDLAALILAWGKMRLGNAQRLFRVPPHQWTAIIADMRNGNCSRKEAYERFAGLRRSAAGKAKGLPGMGPAYYTKLIFFLLRDQPAGYIMDQWTACSINLLCARDVVLTDVQKTWKRSGKLQEAYTVSDQNTSKNYEQFNLVIEDLSQRTGYSCEQIELALFDQGRGKGQWRNHVVQHRQAPYPTPGHEIIYSED